jgi:hypothetical protein
LKSRTVIPGTIGTHSHMHDQFCQELEPDMAGCFARKGDVAGLGDKYFGLVGVTLGDGKMALRGGFGIFHDIANMVSAVNVEASGTPPFSTTAVINSGLCFPACTAVPNIRQSLAAGAIQNLRMLDYHQAQPHMLSYNLNVQRQIPGTIMISIGYAGGKCFKGPCRHGARSDGAVHRPPAVPPLPQSSEAELFLAPTHLFRGPKWVRDRS